MKAAIASDHGKPIFDAGEEWRGATLYAYFTRARLQDVANARNLSLRCATYLMLSVLLIDLHNSASTSEHVYVKRAAACC